MRPPPFRLRLLYFLLEYTGRLQQDQSMISALKTPLFRLVSITFWLAVAVTNKTGAADTIAGLDTCFSMANPCVNLGAIAPVNPATLFQDPLAPISYAAGLTVGDVGSARATSGQIGVVLLSPQPPNFSGSGLPLYLPAGSPSSISVVAPGPLPQVSFVSADPNAVGIVPLQVMPEPSSLSLLAVGLACMGLVYRFAPRKA